VVIMIWLIRCFRYSPVLLFLGLPQLWLTSCSSRAIAFLIIFSLTRFQGVFKESIKPSYPAGNAFI